MDPVQEPAQVPTPRNPRCPAWVWAIVGLVGLAVAALVIGVSSTRERDARVDCIGNLKCIGLAAHIYSSDHGEQFPATLAELQPSYISDSLLFICQAAAKGRQEEPPAFSYIYVGGLTESDPLDCAMAMDVPGNHGDAGGNVLYLGGYVKWVDDATLRRLVQEPWADSTGVKDRAELKSRVRIVTPPSPPRPSP